MILHQDKMASIGLLSAGVAHDINNPIGFVSNNLEELRIYMSRLRNFLEKQQAITRNCADPADLEALLREREELGIDTIFEDFDTLIAESLEGAGRISSIVKNLRSFPGWMMWSTSLPTSTSVWKAPLISRTMNCVTRPCCIAGMAISPGYAAAPSSLIRCS